MKSKNEVIDGIKYLIVKYVSDEQKKKIYLDELANIYPPPVRGIFSEMKQDGIIISDSDLRFVHDAIFYFG